MTTGQNLLSTLDQSVKKEFDSNRRLLAFDEYLAMVAENPDRQMRGSAKYALDMMDHYGAEEPASGEPARFRIFDQPIDANVKRIVGHENIQNHFYRSLKNFTRQGVNNRLLLLHGPNGSAKSSLIHALMAGLERYSKAPDGAIYSFNWIFPIDRYTKGSGGIGMGAYPSTREPVTSFAKLSDEEVVARIPCDMRDHPLLLIPLDQRRGFLEKLIGQSRTDELWKSLPSYLSQGDLCHRCRQIFDALLMANGGDLRKILMHIQVERFYFSRRYRKGLVTIEPQLHVDAQYQQLTMNRSIASLPPSLQGLNLFTMTGDLVDGNRGIIEYSDLLKRPVDTFKYLLGVCETGSINVGSSIAYLDALMLGSTNELQLDAFKEFPDFTSFKARFELVRVPYLLRVSEEKEVYAQSLEQLSSVKHVAPHTAWALALWAVLSRLKKPNSINYPPNVSSIISNLSPLEKARFYDTGETPVSLSPEERKLLKSSARRLWEEYTNIPYYEGRLGASAREMKGVLFDAAQNPDFACVSPLAVMREMEELVKRTTEYDFLKQDVKEGYHDAAEFINTVRNEYLTLIDREVRDSIGLYESTQWEDFLRKYVQHAAIALKKEKIKNAITGKMENPDFSLIEEFEKIVDAPTVAAERDAFRQNIISQVGAWSLDHPNQTVVYAKVFPEFWAKLEKHYYESQKALLTKMHDALLVYGKDGESASSEEGTQLANQTVQNMTSRLGYCENCAKEVITFLMRKKYH